MSLLVYSASAGSGKTYTLALKYICMSLQSGNPNNFSHILAVTFTNKATTEMKERILSQFYNLAMGGLDEGFLEQVMSITHLTKIEVSERAKATLYAIMHDYDSFRVETIDSFFQSLLSNLAHELKLPRSFKVDLDDSLIILTAINNLLLSLDKRGNKELVNAVMGYMRNNVENDKGWNFTSSLNNFAKDNIFRDIYANNAEIIEEATNDADFIGKTHKQMRERMDDIEQQLNSLAEELETVADAIEEDIISNKRNIYSYIKKLRNRSLYKEEPSAYIKKAIDCSDTLLKKSQKNREQYVPLAENVSECILKVEKARVALTPIYNTCLLINKNLDNISMLGHIGREVNSVTNENGTFLLGRTPQLFSQMVGSNDASFVFERDGNTFDHVMIDEFQDTSRMQWHNFKNLLFENLATNQESMLVGDIKQSIYRWRGGDWNILYNIKRYFPKAHVEPKVDNFRSLPIIVKFNNAFFVKAATMLDGTNWDVPNNWQNAEGLVTEDILQRYSPTERNNSLVSILNIYKDIEQTPRSKEHGGYVRIAINDKDVSDDEVIEQMYEQMVLLHSEQGVPYDKMLVLVRKNSQAAQIVNYFSANHPDCPITSDEAFKYVSSSMIMTIIYVLKFMANSNQNELALSLFSLHYDNLIEASVNKELYNETKEQFIGLLHDDVQTKQWLRTPLYELIRQLCETLHFSEIDNECHLEQSAYLFGFMDEVLDFLANNPSDVELFLNYWDEKLSQRSIVANTANAIHVITIHKAKGLEAHTVFIPFCKGQMDEVRGTIWCNLMGENIEDGLLNDTLAHIPLIPVTGADKNSGKNSLFARFYKEEQQQQLIESLNSWYVAFTRARNNLFIWNIKEESVKGQYPFPLIDAFIHNRQPEVDLSNSKKKGNLLELSTAEVVCYGELMPYKAPQLAKSNNPFEQHGNQDINVQMGHGNMNAVNFLQSGKAAEFIKNTLNEHNGDEEEKRKDKQKREYIDRGLLFHSLFSHLHTKDDLERSLLLLRNIGVIANSKQANEIKQTAIMALKQPEAKTWFDGSYQLFNECDILFRNNQSIVMVQRPDRVMINDKEAIVVDYKFGKPKREHYMQVNRYIEHLTHLLKRPVKGYLWYVFEKKVEAVN